MPSGISGWNLPSKVVVKDKVQTPHLTSIKIGALFLQVSFLQDTLLILRGSLTYSKVLNYA